MKLKDSPSTNVDLDLKTLGPERQAREIDACMMLHRHRTLD
jgi:hypothetical protein